VALRSFPSKTFLLGEYVVLEGEAALLLTHGPFFRAAEASKGESPGFHPASPAGLLAAAHGFDTKSLSFLDPHAGRGGFGGSGAEFLAVAHTLFGAQFAPREFARQALRAYRKFGATGSGADILAQAAAPGDRPAFLFVNPSLEEVEVIRPARPLGGEILLFHTGRKLATHAHLGEARRSLRDAGKQVQLAREAIEKGSLPEFATAIQEFSRALEAAGLLAEHSRAALTEIRAQKGVLAAKGCGAMGSDVILVLRAIAGTGAGMDDAKSPSSLEDWARRHSLVEVTRIPI
jgi:mevalonate kinase